MISSLKEIQGVLQELGFELFQILSSYRMPISQTGCNVDLPLLRSTLQAWSRQTGGGSQQKQTAQLQSQAQPLTPMTLLKQVSLVLLLSLRTRGMTTKEA